MGHGRVKAGQSHGSMLVLLSRRLILLYRDISLPVMKVVLWQGKL